jgi:hypothetical protein
MIHVDQYGLEFTTDSNEAAGAYVDALDLFLGNRIETAPRLLRALELDPHFAMARALFAFLLQIQEDARTPMTQILVAAQDATHATRREQHVIDALRRAMAGDIPTASNMIRTHLEDYPRDVLVLREHLLLRSFGGDAQPKESIAAELAGLASHYGEDPWFLGVYSFALSETGDVDAATHMATAGLAAHPGHSVLAHSVAHTQFEKADDASARDFLDAWLVDYGDTVVSAGHLRWHLALAHLALSEPERAFALYERQKGAAPGLEFAREDAISLLWRLHLRGVDISNEWTDLLERTPSGGPRRPFELAHLGFALAALGDHAGLQQLATQAQPFALLTPLIDALRLIATERWSEAAPALEAAAAGVRRLGGSNEQHTILDETIAYARHPARHATV